MNWYLSSPLYFIDPILQKRISYYRIRSFSYRKTFKVDGYHHTKYVCCDCELFAFVFCRHSKEEVKMKTSMFSQEISGGK